MGVKVYSLLAHYSLRIQYMSVTNAHTERSSEESSEVGWLRYNNQIRSHYSLTLFVFGATAPQWARAYLIHEVL